MAWRRLYHQLVFLFIRHLIVFIWESALVLLSLDRNNLSSSGSLIFLIHRDSVALQHLFEVVLLRQGKLCDDLGKSVVVYLFNFDDDVSEETELVSLLKIGYQEIN